MLDSDPIYVAARRVLLDALGALDEHIDSLVLVGAQGVYHHTQHLDLPVGPFTRDADLAIDPGSLDLIPDIEEVMLGAGFQIGVNGNPGEWARVVEIDNWKIEVPVDLLVPETVAPSGSGRRSARLSGHGKRSARKVSGIEAVLVDNAWSEIRALDPSDIRIVRCRIAGPASLLVAKAHKLADRLDRPVNPDRIKDKDALDVYRIARAVPLFELKTSFETLLADERSAFTTSIGIDLLIKLFGSRRSSGVEMAIRSLERVEPAARIIEVFRLLTGSLPQPKYTEQPMR